MQMTSSHKESVKNTIILPANNFVAILHLFEYSKYQISTLLLEPLAKKVYNSLNESLEQLNILSFDQGVFLNKAKIMYKIYNNLVPSYLHEMF